MSLSPANCGMSSVVEYVLRVHRTGEWESNGCDANDASRTIMTETYVLTCWAVGQPKAIPIDDSRFVSLKNAAAAQTVLLGIEEKFDMLLGNFEDLERDLLSMALRNSIRRDFGWDSGSTDRVHVSRRIVNVLSAQRLYRDQVAHDIGRLGELIGIREVSVREFASREYNRSLGYRVMEELRNYIQHRAIPIKGIGYPAHRESVGGDPGLWAFGISVPLDAEVLREDRKVKKLVLDEINALSEEHRDSILFVRQHVEGTARIHRDLRTAIADAVARADLEIRNAVAEWTRLGEKAVGLYAVHRRTSVDVIDRVWISAEPIDRRQRLEGANCALDHLSRRYVTNVREIDAYAATASQIGPSPAGGLVGGSASVPT